MVGHEILEVLYSPINAFKKIIEQPDIKGALIVLLLVIASAVATQYVLSSKQLLEIRTPENENWTEELIDQHVWTSSGSVLLDVTNYQMGNNSISSSVMEANNISLKITDIEPIDSSEETGFSELFFWINWTNEDGVFPTSGKLKLFSASVDSYFETDLSSLLTSSGEWNNITLNVGPDQGWTSNNSPDWQKITGIEFELVWSNSGNITMNVDGLFFRIFASSVEQGINYFAILSLIFQAGTTWVIWAVLLIIVAKLFNEDLGKWNIFFIIIGFVSVVTVVTNIITGILVSTLPDLTYLLDATSTYYYAENSELLFASPAFVLLSLLPWIGYVWTTALSAIVIRLLKDTTWGKALIISVIAFATRLILNSFGF